MNKQQPQPKVGSVLEFIGFIFGPIVALIEWIAISVAHRAFFSFLSKAKRWGQIEVIYPSHKGSKETITRNFGDLKSRHKVVIKIHDLETLLWRCK